MHTIVFVAAIQDCPWDYQFFPNWLTVSLA
jgi:hypothetical protein